jgi:hypothetical protein
MTIPRRMAVPEPPLSWTRNAQLQRILGCVLCFAVTLPVLPRFLCGRGAHDLFHGGLAAQAGLADRVARAVVSHRGGFFYDIRNSRIGGQISIALYQMAILGLGQVVLDHPEKREAYLPAIRAAADRLVDVSTHPYAAEVYGQHGIDNMEPEDGHAYLGYINLALGMVREVDPETPHARLHDRLTDALAARLDGAPTGMIETYPGETWPPDVAAVAASIGLHARITGTDRRRAMERWARRFAECAIDGSGYLVQRVHSGTCEPLDAPRGSGTALASYFLSFADPSLSRRLYEGVLRQGRAGVLGFGAVREYAPGFDGSGDMNAGPAIFGLSVGASGFSIGAAKANGDERFFEALYRSVNLLGLPGLLPGTDGYAAGGVLGDALLLAMLTARSHAS